MIVWLATSTLAQEGGRNLGAGAAAAPGQDNWDRIEQELDEILAAQQEMLDQFDRVLEEVRIVKIRATRRRAPSQ